LIIYTIVQPQFILGKHIDTTNTSCRVIEWNNIKLEVQTVGGYGYRINRVISTNPFDYLNPKLQPGTVIELEFTF